VRRIIGQQLPSAQLVHDSSEDSKPSQAAAGADAEIAQTMMPSFIDVRYRVEGINIEGSGVELSKVFQTLADLVSQGIVKDFTLTRTNLEQVFINFAKFQIQAHMQGDAPAQPASNN